MAGSNSWQVPLQVPLVIGAVILLGFGALLLYYRMKGSARWLVLAIAILLLLGGGVVALFGSSYYYVDRAEAKLHIGASRAEVRAIFRGFREIKVPLTDVPGGPGSDITGDLRHRIYRYQFIIPGLSVHVVYDRHWRVATWVPTYE